MALLFVVVCNGVLVIYVILEARPSHPLARASEASRHRFLVDDFYINGRPACGRSVLQLAPLLFVVVAVGLFSFLTDLCKWNSVCQPSFNDASGIAFS